MFSIGDKAIYTGDPRNLTGTVVDVIYDGWLGPMAFVVEFDDPNLIPRRMQIASVHLSPYTASNLNKYMIQCTCGLKYCKDGGNHSDWCDLVKRKI